MALKKHIQTPEEQRLETTVEDYANNMFADGHNRTEESKKIRNAKEYDDAVKVADPALTDTIDSEAASLNPDGMVEPARSRDGTEASGIYDEDGGPLGGTPKELDALEAGGTPVDRNPHMKD